MGSINVIKGLPTVMRVRILQPCHIRGTAAIEGDVWLLSRAEALTLLDADQAERIRLDGEPLELREAVEIYSEGPDDCAPKLLSRIPERERKPRKQIKIPDNLLIGHVLPDADAAGQFHRRR